MNCMEWEERIALYAGGDLAEAEAQGVDRHVAECGRCQVLLSGLRESLALALEVHAEPVEEAHFAAVRARVLAEIERAPMRRWRFAWMYAMAAAAVVVSIVLWPRPELRLALPMPSAPIAPAVAKVVVKAPVQRPRFRLPAFTQPGLMQSGAPTQTMLIKFETNNPDVVIYWIAETKGETK